MVPADPPRYAVFFTPDGPLARFGAAWLGWDSARGVPVDQPQMPGLDIAKMTATPRGYGLHGTLKPPFRLADGREEPALIAAADRLAAARVPVGTDGLKLARMGGFLVLVPVGDTTALQDLAAACVHHFEPFRAPLTPADLARRRVARLSARQEALLQAYGYPYVLDQFRFHITLTGRLSDKDRNAARAWLAARLAPLLPSPLRIDALSLLRSDARGRFHRIHRARLTG